MRLLAHQSGYCVVTATAEGNLYSRLPGIRIAQRWCEEKTLSAWSGEVNVSPVRSPHPLLICSIPKGLRMKETDVSRRKFAVLAGTLAGQIGLQGASALTAHAVVERIQ